LIYKFEAFELFKAMLFELNKKVISSLTKAHIHLEREEDVREMKEIKKLNLDKYSLGRGKTEEADLQTNDKSQKMQPVRVEKKIGRNDPCPCGSGKKYKNCCGKNV
jgi:preprotein translocase subunit SecA